MIDSTSDMLDSSFATRIARQGVVPIVIAPEAEIAVHVAAALQDGGLDCIEITLRTPEALQTVAAIREAYPEVLLGAGTVVEVEQIADAISAGADFIVSPSLNADVVVACQDRGVPIVPGVATPSEIDLARRLGVHTLKFFPAEAQGGARALAELSGPFGDVRFIPSGGIVPESIPEYLAVPAVLACGGAWMVMPDMLAARDFARVTALAAEARAFVESAR
jgi:2-dehydro-3-deoxyphosphogluconate aldolase / (4S)-4-hydroxy-2-oxoglutarate aldolase